MSRALRLQRKVTHSSPEEIAVNGYDSHCAKCHNPVTSSSYFILKTEEERLTLCEVCWSLIQCGDLSALKKASDAAKSPTENPEGILHDDSPHLTAVDLKLLVSMAEKARDEGPYGPVEIPPVIIFQLVNEYHRLRLLSLKLKEERHELRERVERLQAQLRIRSRKFKWEE